MKSFTTWLLRNVDGVLALLIAVAVGILAVLDVAGPAQLNSAILLVLALLAATLLRDRKSEAKRLADLSAVRQLNGIEVTRELAAAHGEADQWTFKGGTGTYLRAVTLKQCVQNARQEKRPLRMQLEILDPTDEALCRGYAQFRSSLTPGPDGTGETWTFERTRKEAFATVLAACWYRQRYPFVTIDVGLSKIMTTFRWDMSPRCVIMTQDDPSGPALMFDKGKPYYRAYSRELAASFNQAKRVPVDEVRDLPLSEEPTVEETRALFTKLDLELPSAFTDRDVTDLIRKALQAKNPYE
ncbi:MAG: hypothetical protein ACRDQ5_02535 [Sciscionella sp.]